MADANSVLAKYREKALEAEQELKDQKKKLKSLLEESESPLALTLEDSGGALVGGLALPLGINYVVDKLQSKKPKRQPGEPRRPDVYGGAVKTVLGGLTYAANLAIPYRFPMGFARSLVHTATGTLTLYGMTELGWSAILYLEKKHILQLADQQAQLQAEADARASAALEQKKG